MTFAVAFQGKITPVEQHVPRTIAALLRFVVCHRTGWENQHLNVTIASRHRSIILDPRVSTGDRFSVAVSSGESQFKVGHFQLGHVAQLSDRELQQYVDHILENSVSEGCPVSAVVDCQSKSAGELSGTYTQFPGAWIRIAPDRQTGGLVATADHLVLDGAMFQAVLLAMARGSGVEGEDPGGRAGTVPHIRTAREPALVLHVPKLGALTEVLVAATHSLQTAGFRLLEGLDSVLLATIPQAGPDYDPNIVKHRRRIQPLILNLANLNGVEDLRSRIQNLNESGWNSLGAHVWRQIYSGRNPQWLVKYLEEIAPHMPLQQASRYMAGGALMTCLPPVEREQVGTEVIRHFSSRTMGPSFGGPIISVVQSPGNSTDQRSAFITISGCRHWNNIRSLSLLGESLFQRLLRSTVPSVGDRAQGAFAEVAGGQIIETPVARAA